MKWLFVALVFGAFLSCRKKDNALGKELIPTGEYLNGLSSDTFYMASSIVLEDSIITDNAANVLLGQYKDPVFGDYNASFYTQIRLLSTNPDFGDMNTIVVDSFVLGLKYAGYYGDFTPQTFEVFEVTAPLNNDSTYYWPENHG